MVFTNVEVGWSQSGIIKILCGGGRKNKRRRALLLQFNVRGTTVWHWRPSLLARHLEQFTESWQKSSRRNDRKIYSTRGELYLEPHTYACRCRQSWTRTHSGKHSPVKLRCLQYISIKMSGTVSQLLIHVRLWTLTDRCRCRAAQRKHSSATSPVSVSCDWYDLCKELCMCACRPKTGY